MELQLQGMFTKLGHTGYILEFLTILITGNEKRFEEAENIFLCSDKKETSSDNTLGQKLIRLYKDPKYS